MRKEDEKRLGSDNGRQLFGEMKNCQNVWLQSAKVVKLYERFKFQCWKASENGYVVLTVPSMYCQSKYLLTVHS